MSISLAVWLSPHVFWGSLYLHLFSGDCGNTPRMISRTQCDKGCKESLTPTVKGHRAWRTPDSDSLSAHLTGSIAPGREGLMVSPSSCQQYLASALILVGAQTYVEWMNEQKLGRSWWWWYLWRFYLRFKIGFANIVKIKIDNRRYLCYLILDHHPKFTHLWMFM